MPTETAYLEFYDYRSQVESQPEDSGALLKETASVLQDGIAGRRAAAPESRIIAVQFQPSSLQFRNASPAADRDRGDISKPEERRKKGTENAGPPAPQRLSMSVSLVFDRTIYEDSDVTPQVEGLLAAVRSPFTRQVSFNWGELYYMGNITGAQVSYEMFGQDAGPARAKVDLTMALWDTAALPEQG